MTFVFEARQAAMAWKASTTVLPAEAKVPSSYRGGAGPVLPFCIPAAFAELNLLPDARLHALARFEALGIPWHHGSNDRPSNHLLSSQVQCVNALAPMATRPEAIPRIFESVIDIAEPLPFGGDCIDRDDFIVFEWIGDYDYLQERLGKSRTRGANTTSADAAIRYRTSRDTIEIALIEWKYTEQYEGQKLSGTSTSTAERHKRYLELFSEPQGPVRNDILSYESFFVEPFYQLMRLQLLASEMERAHEHDADRVRLVYVAPSRNIELWSSLNREPHRTLADAIGDQDADERPVQTVWEAMVRHPDRFIYLDSATLVADGAPSSPEFKSRYAHLAPPPTAASDNPPPILLNVEAPTEAEWSHRSWDGPWGSWLSLALSLAVGVGGMHLVPAPPLPGSFDPLADAIAWWTPLAHILGYSFGWSDYELGFDVWAEQGNKTDDPRFELIQVWWGSLAPALGWWASTCGVEDRDPVDPDELFARASAQIRAPESEHLLRALLTGGSSPLHLQGHAPIPRAPESEGASAVHMLAVDLSGAPRAAVVFERYEGWYESLESVGASLPLRTDGKPWRLDVRCRDTGHLGTYRKSPVTGRWFSGRHRLHLFGNAV